MKRSIFYFPLLILSILLLTTSCFDILEKIVFNQNGSGTYTLTFNASKSKSNINSIKKLKTINGRKVPTESEINTKIAAVKKYFTQQPGLSNITITTNYTDYIFTLSCNFNNIKNLNSVIEKMKKNKEIGSDIYSDVYQYDASNKLFKKEYKKSFKQKYNTLSTADKEVFKTATYLSVFQFPNTINTINNGNYSQSSSKKAVKFNANILDLITEKKSMNTTIKLN